MEKKSFSLCPDCTACPEVTIHGDGRVTIGEAPNVVALDRGAWNELVRLIRSGAVAEAVG